MTKNKMLGALSIVTVAVLLSACQPKKVESEQTETAASSTLEQEQASQLIGESEKLELNLPECDDKNCPEMTIERLSSNQPFIDAFIDAEILKQVEQILAVTPELSDAEAASTAQASEVAASQAVAQAATVKQQLEQQLQPYTQAFLKLDQEIKALSSNHKISVMIKPTILNAKGPLVTVVLNSSSYLGGAHGSSSQQYYNFDLEKKKLVPLNEVLAPNQLAALENQAHEAFKTWVIEAKLANDVSEYEQAWKFKLSDNYYLSQQGLILQYGEYDIGPYVVGLPRLTIPYEQLQTILKKQYLPEFATTAAASAASEPSK
ncbi:RsiV family protein [Acinetobacter zhairhuonensis]|uniref:RsiV family protein n=1 Tax=Acinetobacter sp. A7.4 TaxID=2919921 RepID=UPI001F500545|nr:RsiV family protein [Acinetobacter sp. A7.4]MCJ8161967.1 RsiV family protein [Acinetobacter sp. A7.4]